MREVKMSGVKMKKRTLPAMVTGVLLAALLAGCSTDCLSSPAGNSGQTAASSDAAETLTETSAETLSALDASELFTSESPDFKAKELSVMGPMVTGLVIENTQKVYEDDVEGNYPQVDFESADDFPGTGWWVDGNAIYIQFWNIKHAPEADFTVDGVKCKLVLPPAAYETVDITAETEYLGKKYTAESMEIYQDSVVLTVKMQDGDFSKNPAIKLRVKGADYMPAWVELNDSEKTIKTLYAVDGPFSVQDIQGLTYSADRFTAINE